MGLRCNTILLLPVLLSAFPISSLACTNEEVFSIQEAREKIKQADMARLKQATQNQRGGIDIPPRSADEEERYGQLYRAINGCAHAGNPFAAYVVGTDLKINAEDGEELAAKLGSMRELQYPKIQVQLASLKSDAAKQYQEAMSWYRKASDAGVVAAMFSIGELYRDGKGVAKSAFVAVEWFDRAARTALNAGGSREFAVRCLEEMTKVAPRHPLTVRLTDDLYGSALPK